MNSNVSVLKNIEALTNAVTFRRTGVYVTTVGEKPKVLSSSKGVFDIHEKTTPQQVYSSVAPDLAREDVKGNVRRKQLHITNDEGKAEKVVHLVRQQIQYKPRVSQKELSILDGMLSLAKGRGTDQPPVKKPRQATYMIPPEQPLVKPVSLQSEDVERVIASHNDNNMK